MIYKTHEEKCPAPFVATFSSRGPNPGSHNVLKVLIVFNHLNFVSVFPFATKCVFGSVLSQIILDKIDYPKTEYS